MSHRPSSSNPGPGGNCGPHVLANGDANRREANIGPSAADGHPGVSQKLRSVALTSHPTFQASGGRCSPPSLEQSPKSSSTKSAGLDVLATPSTLEALCRRLNHAAERPWESPTDNLGESDQEPSSSAYVRTIRQLLGDVTSPPCPCPTVTSSPVQAPSAGTGSPQKFALAPPIGPDQALQLPRPFQEAEGPEEPLVVVEVEVALELDAEDDEEQDAAYTRATWMVDGTDPALQEDRGPRRCSREAALAWLEEEAGRPAPPSAPQPEALIYDWPPPPPPPPAEPHTIEGALGPVLDKFAETEATWPREMQRMYHTMAKYRDRWGSRGTEWS